MRCPFCKLIADGTWLCEATHAVAIADAFPLTPDHSLVLPRRHEPDFFALDAREREAVFALAWELKRVLAERHQPDGFNLGVNIGDAAGQTVGHAHLHLIPRYRGDVREPRGGIRWIIPEKAAYWR
jgi:diadenosine tetraphosphate (Ap4A) HIT family hydrolase